ncbi:hypothetical protein PoB_002437400 [Plakobranchus ocellatus]|uniref:Uncharacterized protein n=1 Tax=Plakobranchus ocellatus TaxID=259542 RepID=A0AAV3ZVE2_9GAST|nr:hypothetical protein PoB_002437400 [Plakobranchus ocellatus]
MEGEWVGGLGDGEGFLFQLRRFSTEKGMKIHRTRMKCQDKKPAAAAQADKTTENQGQVQNYSAEEVHVLWKLSLEQQKGVRVWLALAVNITLPQLKASIYDTTILLDRLVGLMNWSRMNFKPKKYRSKIDEDAFFEEASRTIPGIGQEPVKGLGRWYDSSLKDTKCRSEALVGLQALDKCGLPGE